MTDDAPSRGSRSMLVRADASNSIGTGHVVRCLTLSDELHRRGWNVTFVAREIPDRLAQEAKARGHRVVRLPRDLDVGLEPRRLAMTCGRHDVAVVDHYSLGRDWEAAIRNIVTAVVVVDDLADRPHDADLLINQNLGAAGSAYAGLLGPDAELLLGPRYAIVRPEFAETRERLGIRTTSVGRILVFLSGSDEHNVTAVAARAIAGLPGVLGDIVCGPANRHLSELRQLALEWDNLRLHLDTPDMAALMGSADLAVGAPSSASWERCCLGLPAVLITLAENQEAVGRELHRIGAGLLLGGRTEVAESTVRRAVTLLLDDPDTLHRMRAAAASIVDGHGVGRVADRIEQVTATRGEREEHDP